MLKAVPPSQVFRKDAGHPSLTHGRVMDKSTNWNEISEHERRSCATKKYFAFKPPPRAEFDSYSCKFCGGWHLTSKFKKRNGDVKYTEEGWPIVPRHR